MTQIQPVKLLRKRKSQEKKFQKMTEYRRRISKESSEIVYAAEYGDFSRVEKILKVAPKLVNTKTSAGWSATHMAARFLILKFSTKSLIHILLRQICNMT